jgi:glycosyltransferase involved in cell wall biosynthesis
LKSIKQQVRSRGLDNVTFRPFQPEERLRETLCAIDVHLVTLRPDLEGLVVPSKIYGIAAAGRPALFVGDTQGEIGSLLKKYDFGAVVADGDVDSLVQNILALRASPALCQRLGENARSAFESNFDRDHIIALWRTLFDDLYPCAEPVPNSTARDV